MRLLYSDLGNLEAGDVVVVTISGDSMNVRLFDSSNFSAFSNNRQAQGFGGHATKSPVRLVVPRAGHWYVVLDRGGYAFNVRWGARVERRRGRILPPLRSSQPVPATIPELADIGHNLNDLSDAGGTSPQYDVFISHASEDKDDVVRPLAAELAAAGLSVWYDEYELRVGDSLRRKIDRGIAHSRYGIVVLSPAFFARNWTQYELDGLVTKEMSGTQVILPLWHNLSREELISHSPSLADKVALSTANYTVVEIATQITAAVTAVRA